MQAPARGVIQVVPRVWENQIDNTAFRQVGRFVHEQSAAANPATIGVHRDFEHTPWCATGGIAVWGTQSGR